MSTIPYKLEKIASNELDKEVLRTAMIAELDAVNLYEQLSAIAKTPLVKKLFLDIAKEEKTHMGEFQTLLLEHDAEQVNEIENAKKEVSDLKK